jgi:DnaD/phage-associated family protein
MAFSGFSTDGLVSLPPELFSEIVPAISLPSELKVTLHVFYLVSRQRETPRRVNWDMLASDAVLRQGLQVMAKLRPVEDLLEEGLAAAVGRKSLLHLALPGNGRTVNWYLVNTAANRAWIARVEPATLALSRPLVEAQRPSILALYEQNIGLVTPMLVDELREAADRYPDGWIEDAMREAVRANARSWRYIRKVLERWAAHGRQDAPNRPERPIDVEKYTGDSGQFGGLFRRGGDDSDL